MKTFLCEESVLRHNKTNCFPSYLDHYLITNISNGRHENVKKHTWLIESKLFEGVLNILSGMINKSKMQNTRDAKNSICICQYI